jgi:hypothetical protein
VSASGATRDWGCWETEGGDIIQVNLILPCDRKTLTEAIIGKKNYSLRVTLREVLFLQVSVFEGYKHSFLFYNSQLLRPGCWENPGPYCNQCSPPSTKCRDRERKGAINKQRTTNSSLP